MVVDDDTVIKLNGDNEESGIAQQRDKCVLYLFFASCSPCFQGKVVKKRVVKPEAAKIQPNKRKQLAQIGLNKVVQKLAVDLGI